MVIFRAGARSKLKVEQMVEALLLAARLVQGANFKLIRILYRGGGPGSRGGIPPGLGAPLHRSIAGSGRGRRTARVERGK